MMVAAGKTMSYTGKQTKPNQINPHQPNQTKSNPTNQTKPIQIYQTKPNQDNIKPKQVKLNQIYSNLKKPNWDNLKTIST